LDEDVEIIESEYNEKNNTVMNYMTSNSNKDEDREVIFSSELGLAIEKPPKGVSIDQLWKILNTDKGN